MTTLNVQRGLESSAVAAPSRDFDGYYRRLIQGMRCGVLTIDRAGRLVMFNDQACQILDLDAPPQIGGPLEAALEGHPQLAQILRESFTMSSLPNRAEIDLRCRSEQGKTIGFTLSLVRGDAGETVGAAIFFKDLTHVEHREEQERLKDRLAALGQMAANLAHEIRNPLASIEVSASLLKRRVAPEPSCRELVDKMVSEIRRLNASITSSLEFVRPLSTSLAPMSIEPVLDDALVVAQGRRGGEFAIHKRYHPGIPPFRGDRDKLRQVFENLFLNAMEAMGAQGGGQLLVETSRMPAPVGPSTPYQPADSPADPWSSFTDYVVIRVADTGPGIPEDYLDKLFHPFFTSKPNGSGVGLAMARKIVDAHRGLIDVKNRTEGGAEFTVRLPLLEADQEV